MFTIEELSGCLSQPWFSEGYGAIERNLLLARLGQPTVPLAGPVRKHLKRFAQAVISSAVDWEDPRERRAKLLCQYAADIEASLSIEREGDSPQDHVSHLKAIFLYELAGLPGASSSHAARNGLEPQFRSFFTREGDSLWRNVAANWSALSAESGVLTDRTAQTAARLLEESLGEILADAGRKLQAAGARNTESPELGLLSKLAGDFSMGLTSDDVLALKKLLALRTANSSIAVVPEHSALTVEDLRAISAPVELWPAQAIALREGLLDAAMRSFGFAAPTGTGKTALTRILIANALRASPGSKIFYICPSRALVHEVWTDLSASLKGIGANVFEAGGHLTSHDNLGATSGDPDVIIFTPERADLLLRVDPEFLAQTSLVIVDEAHHIEQGSRGILLELYLWRLTSMIPPSARVIQLSAVAPNISDLTSWLSTDQKTHSVMVDARTSSLRVGLLNRTGDGAGSLRFGQAEPYEIIPSGTLSADATEGLATFANSMAENSIVLVLCMSPGSAEKVARAVAKLRSEEQSVDDDVSERLDAWVERELYPESELREHFKKRVLFHHAQMPPRVRLGIEEAVRARKVDVICATTTLAEGVNFPFSTVIVESLVGQQFQLTPRALWNIAGRAGRFGVDTEGLCILYRPELWTKRLKDYKLEDYLQTALVDIPPVQSALAQGIAKLNKLVSNGTLSLDDFDHVSLSNIKIDGKATAEAKEVRALINLMRVGYAHASSTGIINIGADGAPEYKNQLLASHQLSEVERVFAEQVGNRQRRVVKEATAENPTLIEIAAKVGWSLEAQSNIYRWLDTREDWQLDQFGNLVVGGYIRNVSRVNYLIGPVAKHLLAFDGEALGGAYAYLAEKWIAGMPLSNFQAERDSSFGKMIAKIYGRMQYLLPWGLFGMHELLQYEGKRRGMVIGDGVSALSVLAAEGLPNFDALTLTLSLGVERADATRLSEAYKLLRLKATPIVDWLATLPWSRAEEIVRGTDQRRVDPMFRALHRRLLKERMQAEE
ncbi:putative DEAD/DEAH box helicase domain protein [Cupriavidus taiwanensis]|uniref:DEAD/DEAH box helicase n=1 Tax=Cupriavidus taiwanensis TaxID=164546 RepID=UPI000E1A6A1D|nr:DEAD/DEAH box helicase [Cupriavidus taiwanensis]SOY83463.1 putative DEAD/DEAH box helicase domain protein [Cupriavidus taiwanensis]SOY84908.1 putative DEAD/DEAH box helicase domain protein [Cupriavidus taiwanensis]